MALKFTAVIALCLFLTACTKNAPSQNQISQKQPASQAQSPTPTTVDYKASFAIFTNGTFRIFTKTMYHNRSADVFIEKSAPNTVRVKREKVTWGEFFQTLPAPFNMSSDCLTTGTGQKFCSNEDGTLKFYLNGVLTNNLLNRQIKNSDKVLVSYGRQSEEEIKKQLEQIPKIS